MVSTHSRFCHLDCEQKALPSLDSLHSLPRSSTFTSTRWPLRHCESEVDKYTEPLLIRNSAWKYYFVFVGVLITCIINIYFV